MSTIQEKLFESLCEGLVGYATYESRSGMGPAMSELVFYMPTLRIANHLDWKSRVEFGATEPEKGRGDRPRVDFALTRGTEASGKCGVVIEMKWEPKLELRHKRFILSESEWDKFKSLGSTADKKVIQNYSAWQVVLGRKTDLTAASTRKPKQMVNPEDIGLHRKSSGEDFPLVKSFQTNAGLGYFCNAYRVMNIDL